MIQLLYFQINVECFCFWFEVGTSKSVFYFLHPLASCLNLSPKSGVKAQTNWTCRTIFLDDKAILADDNPNISDHKFDDVNMAIKAFLPWKTHSNLGLGVIEPYLIDVGKLYVGMF